MIALYSIERQHIFFIAHVLILKTINNLVITEIYFTKIIQSHSVARNLRITIRVNEISVATFIMENQSGSN